MTTYSTLIIDDEAPARIRIRRLLAAYHEKIRIIDEATDGIEALQKINNLKPDLVFLDIQMPGLNGFEVLQQAEHLPVVIFTTAFDQYALQAFETNSVDYLLKPIESERLKLAIEKLERLNGGTSRDQIQKIVAYVNQLKPKREITSFPVKTGDTIHLVRVTEVAYLEAKDKYVTIHTLEGKQFLTDVSLKAMEEKLPDNFLRVHRAFIVNKNIVTEIHKYFQGRYAIVLNDKLHSRIITGSGYADSIRSTLEQL